MTHILEAREWIYCISRFLPFPEEDEKSSVDEIDANVSVNDDAPAGDNNSIDEIDDPSIPTNGEISIPADEDKAEDGNDETEIADIQSIPDFDDNIRGVEDYSDTELDGEDETEIADIESIPDFDGNIRGEEDFSDTEPIDDEVDHTIDDDADNSSGNIESEEEDDSEQDMVVPTKIDPDTNWVKTEDDRFSDNEDLDDIDGESEVKDIDSTPESDCEHSDVDKTGDIDSGVSTEDNIDIGTADESLDDLIDPVEEDKNKLATIFESVVTQLKVAVVGHNIDDFGI